MGRVARPFRLFSFRELDPCFFGVAQTALPVSPVARRSMMRIALYKEPCRWVPHLHWADGLRARKEELGCPCARRSREEGNLAAPACAYDRHQPIVPVARRVGIGRCGRWRAVPDRPRARCRGCRPHRFLTVLCPRTGSAHLSTIDDLQDRFISCQQNMLPGYRCRRGRATSSVRIHRGWCSREGL